MPTNTKRLSIVDPSALKSRIFGMSEESASFRNSGTMRAATIPIEAKLHHVSLWSISLWPASLLSAKYLATPPAIPQTIATRTTTNPIQIVCTKRHLPILSEVLQHYILTESVNYLSSVFLREAYRASHRY